MKKIVFDNNSISFMQRNQDDYISLTDMAKHKNAESTGLVISHWLRVRVMRSNSWEYGSRLTTPILMLLNSVTLDSMLVATVTFFPSSNGLNGQMQSGLFRVPVVMEEHTPIGTLHLNLVLG